MRSVEWFCVTSKKPLKCATPFLPRTLKPSSFFLLQQSNDVWLWQCGMHTVQMERWGVLWNGQKAGGLSLRVKRDERVGVWWLDGVDVSVMAWCQTLCHCQCQPHQPIPQWSATVQCVSKPLCLLPLQSVCWCCCVVPLLPFVQSPSH